MLAVQGLDGILNPTVHSGVQDCRPGSWDRDLGIEICGGDVHQDMVHGNDLVHARVSHYGLLDRSVILVNTWSPSGFGCLGDKCPMSEANTPSHPGMQSNKGVCMPDAQPASAH